jgi:hypothetical protein
MARIMTLDHLWLLAGPLAAAEFATLPLDQHFVHARMRRPRFQHATVDRRELALGLKFFLQRALGIAAGLIAFAAYRRQRRLHQAQDNRARAFPAGLRIDRADHRLHRVRQDRAALSSLAVFLAPAEDEMVAQAQLLGQGLEMMPVHEPGAQHRQPAFGQLGKATVKLRRHRELQHRVAQEFQPLIVRQLLPFFMPEGGMRQGLAQQHLIGKSMSQPLLKLVESGIHSRNRCTLISKLVSLGTI